MAKLITCPTCGNPVSENAVSCPCCGEPITQYVREQRGFVDDYKESPLALLIASIFWFILGIILFFAKANNLALLIDNGFTIYGIYAFISAVCVFFSIYTIGKDFCYKGRSIVALIISVLNVTYGIMNFVSGYMR